MTTLKMHFAALLLLCGNLLHGQSDGKEIKGVVVKMGLGKSVGLSGHQLIFQQDWSDVSVSFAPGAGVNLNGGVGIWSEKFDFELLLDQSFSFSSLSTRHRFFKTNILATGYLKFPARSGHLSFYELESFRLGFGPMLMIPGPFVVTIEGSELGRATYQPSWGGHLDANLVFSLERYAVIPGLRIQIGNVTSSNMTLDQNQATLRRLNVACFAFYLAGAF